MHKYSSTLIAITCLLLQVFGPFGYAQERAVKGTTIDQSSAGSESQATGNIVEIRAVGMKFEAPEEVPAGWTTFRLINASGMVHFAMIDRPPPGVTAGVMSSTSAVAFQALMDAMNAGDQAGVDAAYDMFPPWLGEMQYMGGPGFLSPGMTSAATVYLEPGYYVLECYVKTDGIFHSTRPNADSLGMLHEFRATKTPSTGLEPSPTAIVNISNSGLALVEGGFVAGDNTIRVNFVEQQAFPTFVGNDVHVLRLNSKQDLAIAARWLDWREPEGMETPAPITFLGGINDMPAGSHGYIHLNLESGDYALIGEVPEPQAIGFTLPFSVSN